MTQSSRLISFKERQEKADVDRIAESLAVASVDEEEVSKEELEELVWKSRLLCSSPSSQLARQLHSEAKRSIKALFFANFPDHLVLCV